MAIPPSYDVRYCRPPKPDTMATRVMRQARPKPVVEIIDEFFVGEIDIVEKGISRVSNFEALVLQLWIMSMAGKKPGHERFVSVSSVCTDWVVGERPKRSERVIELSRHDTVIVST